MSWTCLFSNFDPIRLYNKERKLTGVFAFLRDRKKEKGNRETSGGPLDASVTS